MAKSARSINDEVKLFKREAVLQASLELFYEKGYAGTTVDMIAERLSVTKPFVYGYFDSKGDILVALYEKAMSRIIELFDEAMATETLPSGRLRALLIGFARENMESQTISSVFMQEEKHLNVDYLSAINKRQGEFDRRVASLIQEGVAIGEFHVSNPALAARGIIGMVRWTQRWYKPGGKLPIQEIAAELAEMGLKSLGWNGSASDRPE